MLFSYIGPETTMLVPSIIAAVAGIFMMGGRNVMGFCRGVVRRIWPGARRKPVSGGVATSVSPTPEESPADQPETPSAV
jgi:hypothetical protein